MKKQSTYNLSMEREPTDEELEEIMKEAAKVAAERARKADEAFWAEVNKAMEEAIKAMEEEHNS